MSAERPAASRPPAIVVLGLGMGAAPHILALLELAAEGAVTLRGGWSRSEARRAAAAARFGLPVSSDLDALLDGDVDAALLLTPPDARADLVARLAGRGLAILMEKPIERTTAAAEEIARACAGLTAGVVLQHRFRDGAVRLAELVGGGKLGTLATVQLTVPWWRAQAYYDEPGRGTLARDGGGVLISQAIHALDLMLSLTGPVAEVAAVAGTSALHRMETEDFVGAGLRFASGAMGGLVATTAAFPGGPERLVLGGTEATATLEAGTLQVAWRDGRAETVGEPAATGGGADPMAFPHGWHKRLIADFVQAVRTGGRPRIPVDEALLVHRLIDALLRSARERRTIEVENRP